MLLTNDISKLAVQMMGVRKEIAKLNEVSSVVTVFLYNKNLFELIK